MRKGRKRKKKDLHLSLAYKRNGSLGPSYEGCDLGQKSQRSISCLFSLYVFSRFFPIFEPGTDANLITGRLTIKNGSRTPYGLPHPRTYGRRRSLSPGRQHTHERREEGGGVGRGSILQFVISQLVCDVLDYPPPFSSPARVRMGMARFMRS